MNSSSRLTVWSRSTNPSSRYIGAITNEEERLLDIPTDFLKPGNYRLEAIEDGINANARAEDYKKTEKNIKSGETLKLKLAAGGGWVARVVPSN